MIGRVFSDRYEITERIGIGGMAEVYKAQDQVLRRVVAVKVMLPQYAADKEFTELTIGVTPGEAPHEFLLFSQVRPIEQKTGNPVIHARGSEAVITQALTERRDEIADAISKEFMAALNSAKKSAKFRFGAA